MESAYDRFNYFDFEGNARFQEGLRNIQESSATENILKLKIFYYNRYVKSSGIVPVCCVCISFGDTEMAEV